jgi:glutamate racemase
MSTDNRPIGVFDSGLGGLTVVCELQKQLPGENIIYFGDTARVPYGTKSAKTVQKYAIEASYLLTTHNIKAIVIACNTASAHALKIVQSKFSIPVFGVIEPGVAAALAQSKNKNVLIIGTSGTIKSEAYQNRLSEVSESEVTIWSQACPLFVPLVEEGMLEGEIATQIIRFYLQRFQKTQVDTVILGCTHYPLLKNSIAAIWPGVTLIDSGIATANAVKNSDSFEKSENRNKTGHTRYILSDFAENFLKIGQTFLGNEMHHLEVLDFEHFVVSHQSEMSKLY